MSFLHVRASEAEKRVSGVDAGQGLAHQLSKDEPSRASSAHVACDETDGLSCSELFALIQLEIKNDFFVSGLLQLRALFNLLSDEVFKLCMSCSAPRARLMRIESNREECVALILLANPSQ